MTAKELIDNLDTWTAGQQTSRLANLRSGLAKLDLMPAFNRPLHPQEAGLFVWLFAVCPQSRHDKVTAWMKAQQLRMNAAAGQGQPLTNFPHVAIGQILGDVKAVRQIESMGIETTSGAVIVNYHDGSQKIVSTYSATDADLTGAKIHSLTVFPAYVLERLSMAIAIGWRRAIIEADEKRTIEKLIEA